MKSPAEIGRALLRRYELHAGQWLNRAFSGQPFEVQTFSVSVPKSEAAADVKRYADWETEWRNISGPGIRIVTEPVSWKELGRTEKLFKVMVTSPKGAFLLMPGGRDLGDRFLSALQRLEKLACEGQERLVQAYLEEARFVLNAPEAEFYRMTQATSWLREHPRADCYIRELPVEGIDTKWLERNKGLVARLMSVALRLKKPLLAADVAARWNLLSPPVLVRVRHANLLAQGLPPDALVALPPRVLAQQPVRRVAVVENLQTGLALCVPDDVLIVVGMGTAVQTLADVPWSREAEIFYMGDLDQHGVAILGQIRRRLPQVRSVLMTPDVLKRWRHLAVADPTQTVAVPAEGLTAEEQDLLQYLQRDHLRLEQERLGMDEINRAFAVALRDSEGKSGRSLRIPCGH